MPSTTGTVTSFQGVLTALLAYVHSVLGIAITGESIGTPDGTIVTFVGNLAKTEVVLNTFSFAYTIGTVAYTGVSDATGNITGTSITSGTLEVDGSYTITFTTAPDDATTLLAEYEYPTWTVELNQNAKTNALGYTTDTSWGAGTREVILKSLGTSGTENIFVGIREVKYPAGSLYGWNLNTYKFIPPVALGWNGNQTETGLTAYTGTQQSWYYLPFLNFADTTMAYWFTVTKDYMTVVVRVSSDYFTCYLGNGKRLMEPSIYPSPAIAAGTVTYNYNYQSGYNGGIVRPYMSSSFVSFFAINSYPNQEYMTGSRVKMYPMQGEGDNTNVGATDAGEVLLLPSFVFDDVADTVMFQLDGVYAARRDSLQSEDVITDGADTYIVFQQGSSLANYNYLAIKQV